jgi:hypothetical protein
MDEGDCMSDLRKMLAETVEELRKRDTRVKAETILREMWDRFSELLGDESRRLMDQALWKLVRDLCREEEDQQDLPGIGIPKILNLSADGDSYVVASEDCNWAELSLAYSVRVQKVTQSQVRVDRFAAGLSLVGPLMSGDPSMTLRDAMAQLLVMVPA